MDLVIYTRLWKYDLDSGDKEPIPDTFVEILALNLVLNNVQLAETRSTLAGEVSLNLSGNNTEVLKIYSSSCRLYVKDKVGRVLHRQSLADIQIDAGLEIQEIVLGEIEISSKDLRGWKVTNLTGSPTLVTQNNHVEFYIDNEIAWERLSTYIKNSSRYINWQCYAWNINAPYFLPIGFENLLVDAANDPDRNITVRVLQRDINLPFIPHAFETEHEAEASDTSDLVVDFFDRESNDAIEVRRYITPLHFQAHAKLAVFDGQIAQIRGSPLFPSFFDNNAHNICNILRCGRGPTHDVDIMLSGPAVTVIDDYFYLHWNSEHTAVAVPVDNPPDRELVTPVATGNTTVQIIRTLPGEVFPDLPYGEQGILESYLRCIAEAQDFIYLENQYFSNYTIVNAIINAMMDRSRDSLQFIIVVSWPSEGMKQERLICRLNELLNTINNADPYGVNHIRERIGIFTLWTHEFRPFDIEEPRCICPYDENEFEEGEPSTHYLVPIRIHSKVGVADDQWLTIGTANLDHHSLSYTENIPKHVYKLKEYDQAHELVWKNTLIGKEIDGDIHRASEINAVIFNGIDGEPDSPVPPLFRRTLWAEHLGFLDKSGKPDPEHPDLLLKPEGGWLELWRSRAQQKLDGLRSSPIYRHPAKVLEGIPKWNPQDYLQQLLRVSELPIIVLNRTPAHDCVADVWTDCPEWPRQ